MYVDWGKAGLMAFLLGIAGFMLVAGLVASQDGASPPGLDLVRNSFLVGAGLMLGILLLTVWLVRLERRLKRARPAGARRPNTAVGGIAAAIGASFSGLLIWGAARLLHTSQEAVVTGLGAGIAGVLVALVAVGAKSVVGRGEPPPRVVSQRSPYRWYQYEPGKPWSTRRKWAWGLTITLAVGMGTWLSLDRPFDTGWRVNGTVVSCVEAGRLPRRCMVRLESGGQVGIATEARPGEVVRLAAFRHQRSQRLEFLLASEAAREMRRQ